jgi:ribosome-binding protein aMBF1 (putative translation factor)
VINNSTDIRDISSGLANSAKELKRSPNGRKEPKFKTLEEKRQFIRKAYKILTDPNRPTDANSVAYRLELKEYIEDLLGTKSKNTRDFKDSVENFLGGLDQRRRPLPEGIKKARKKMKWTQKQLATHLGYKSHVPIAQYETGQRNPSKRVLQWLKEMGM